MNCLKKKKSLNHIKWKPNFCFIQLNTYANYRRGVRGVGVGGWGSVCVWMGVCVCMCVCLRLGG